jgi:hypothetical protein
MAITHDSDRHHGSVKEIIEIADAATPETVHVNTDRQRKCLAQSRICCR